MKGRGGTGKRRRKTGRTHGAFGGAPGHVPRHPEQRRTHPAWRSLCQSAQGSRPPCQPEEERRTLAGSFLGVWLARLQGLVEEAAARLEGLRRELLLEFGVARVPKVLGLGVVFWWESLWATLGQGVEHWPKCSPRLSCQPWNHHALGHRRRPPWQHVLSRRGPDLAVGLGRLR